MGSFVGGFGVSLPGLGGLRPYTREAMRKIVHGAAPSGRSAQYLKNDAAQMYSTCTSKPARPHA